MTRDIFLHTDVLVELRVSYNFKNSHNVNVLNLFCIKYICATSALNTEGIFQIYIFFTANIFLPILMKVIFNRKYLKM